MIMTLGWAGDVRVLHVYEMYRVDLCGPKLLLSHLCILLLLTFEAIAKQVIIKLLEDRGEKIHSRVFPH